MNRTLIETFLNKALRDMHDAPERSIRNFIELGTHFADGRFQKEFFEAAQTMLQDETSAYYRLVTDTIHNVNNSHLSAFIMNILYDSCTLAARTIRQTEEKEHFDIPWSIYLHIDDQHFDVRREAYSEIFENAKALGIHTFNLFTNKPEKLLPLASESLDCAFFLFCDPCTITDSILYKLAAAHNVMPVISFNDSDPQTATACAMLREQKIPYSVYMQYSNDDASQISDEYPWCDAEQMHAIMTIIIPKDHCSKKATHDVYQSIRKARHNQEYATIPWDGVSDNCYMDSIISDRSCIIGFDADGKAVTLHNGAPHPNVNLFHNDLKQIFKAYFEK